MSWSPLKVLQDWSGLKKLKSDLLFALQRTRPGAGVTVTIAGLDPDRKRITERAIIELTREYPSMIECTEHGESVTLMRKGDMHRSMGKETHGTLVDTLGVFTADNLTKGGFGDKDRLPYHPYRDGIPVEQFQGAPAWMVGETEYEAKKQAIKAERAARKAGGLVDVSGRPISSEES